jgi:DNA-directed RNA polymerase specialized sigma24 family protein
VEVKEPVADRTPNDRPLSSDAYDRLLALLGAGGTGPASGERRFGELRARLLRLFEWRGARFPEDLADETLARVARRLGDGIEIRAEDPFRYVCGVAHLVFKESLREARRTVPSEEAPEPITEPDLPDFDPDERLDALRACLESLGDVQRRLVLDYHQGERRGRIDGRKQIAERLGIELNALRIRVHRLRTRLEGCIASRLGSH